MSDPIRAAIETTGRSIEAPRPDVGAIVRSARRRLLLKRATIGVSAAVLLGIAVLALPLELPQLRNREIGGTNHWDATAEAPLAGRSEAFAVWTGDEVIVWGGAEPSEADEQASRGLVDGAAYDPVADTWRLLASAPLNTPYGRTAVWNGSEVLIWGGEIGDGSHARPDDGAAYDPRADSWRLLPPSPYWSLAQHTAVWTGQEMVVFGGVEGAGSSGATYDPATNQWRKIPSPPVVGRFGHAAVWTGAEMIVWGGRDVRGKPLSDGAAYDPGSNRWRRLSASPLDPRTGALAVWTGDKMIVWGGMGENSSLSDGATYDPATDRWERIREAPISAAIVDPKALWVSGRMIAAGSGGEMAEYDLASDRWKLLPKPPGSPRLGPSMVGLEDQLFIWGGVNLSDGSTKADGATYELGESG